MRNDLYLSLTHKFREHSRLSREDHDAIRRIPARMRELKAGEDLVRQGEHPTTAVIVLFGMVGRYQTLRSGHRQYLSFHIAGDMPDAQSLFLERMDHSVCAIDRASVAMVAHKELLDAFKEYPNLGLAMWRETLIDAAIFRQAITNNGSRPSRQRVAHFFCEQYYRANLVGLAKNSRCPLPLSQSQIGDALGLSLVTANRVVKALRATGLVDHRDDQLIVHDWQRLAEFGEFDPSYLFVRKEITRNLRL